MATSILMKNSTSYQIIARKIEGKVTKYSDFCCHIKVSQIDRKIHFCHFQIDIIQTSLLQKVSEKKIVSTQSYGRKKICGINFL